MKSDGWKLAEVILKAVNDKDIAKGDGNYYPRTSAIGRCPRDATMHAYDEPWSDPPESMWGQQLRFDMGHDAEVRVIDAMEIAGITVCCQQMTVEIETPMGLKVTGHMDGVIVIPHDMPHGGKWYVMDVKSAGPYMYRKIYDEQESKGNITNRQQISIYAESVINDEKFPDLNGNKVSDLLFEGYEYGGGMLAYIAIDRPTKGYGPKKVDYPKLHLCQFEIESFDVEMYLDKFDDVQIHLDENTLPGIPHSSDEAIWGGIRCSPRWCRRYSVCQSITEPQSKKLREVLLSLKQ